MATLNGEVFAIDILQIREIIEFGALTEVPMMPPTIRGVINLRGSVVPVIDLSARFGRGPSAVARRTCVVILEVSKDGVTQTLGVMVDAVNEGHGNSGGRHRAGAGVRHPHPYRFHCRHGAGERAVRDHFSTWRTCFRSTNSPRWVGWPARQSRERWQVRPCHPI